MSRRRPPLSPRTVALIVLAGAGLVVLSLAIFSTQISDTGAGTEPPALPPPSADARSDVNFSAALPDETSDVPALPEHIAPVTPLAPSRPERAPRADASARSGPTRIAVLAFTTTGEALQSGLDLPGGRFPLAVVASDAPIDPGSLHAEGDERGVFRPRKGGPLPNGLLGQLEVEPPVTRYASLVLRHLVLDTVELSLVTDRVRFTVDVPRLKSQLGQVQLAVTDAQTGLPLGSAVASLTGRDPWTGRTFTRQPVLAPHDVLAFSSVPPGPVVLTLEAAGYERRVLEADVPAGRGLDLGTLALARWVTITGHIVDQLCRPGATEISIFNAGTGSSLASRTPVCTGTARADGFFVLSALGRDQYLLRARRLDKRDLHLALIPIDTRAGEVRDLRVELATARKVTFLLDSDDVSDLQLSRPDGTIISTWLAADRPDSYKVQLVPGDYRLAVARDGRVVEERTIEVDERTSVISVAR